MSQHKTVYWETKKTQRVSSRGKPTINRWQCVSGGLSYCYSCSRAFTQPVIAYSWSVTWQHSINQNAGDKGIMVINMESLCSSTSCPTSRLRGFQGNSTERLPANSEKLSLFKSEADGCHHTLIWQLVSYFPFIDTVCSIFIFAFPWLKCHCIISVIMLYKQ